MKRIVFLLLIVILVWDAIPADASEDFDQSVLKNSRGFAEVDDFWSFTAGWNNRNFRDPEFHLDLYLSSTYISEGWGPELRIQCKIPDENTYNVVTAFKAELDGEIFSFDNLPYNAHNVIHGGYVIGGDTLRDFLIKLVEAKHIVFQMEYVDADGMTREILEDNIRMGAIQEMKQGAQALLESNAFSENGGVNIANCKEGIEDAQIEIFVNRNPAPFGNLFIGCTGKTSIPEWLSDCISASETDKNATGNAAYGNSVSEVTEEEAAQEAFRDTTGLQYIFECLEVGISIDEIDYHFIRTDGVWSHTDNGTDYGIHTGSFHTVDKNEISSILQTVCKIEIASVGEGNYAQDEPWNYNYYERRVLFRLSNRKFVELVFNGDWLVDEENHYGVRNDDSFWSIINNLEIKYNQETLSQEQPKKQALSAADWTSLINDIFTMND